MSVARVSGRSGKGAHRLKELRSGVRIDPFFSSPYAMSSLEGEAKAALILLANVRPVLVSHAKIPKTIEGALGGIFGFNRTKKLTIKVGPSPINDFLRCAHGTSLRKGEIDTARNLPNGASYSKLGPSRIDGNYGGRRLPPSYSTSSPLPEMDGVSVLLREILHF